MLFALGWKAGSTAAVGQDVGDAVRVRPPTLVKSPPM